MRLLTIDEFTVILPKLIVVAFLLIFVVMAYAAAKKTISFAYRDLSKTLQFVVMRAAIISTLFVNILFWLTDFPLKGKIGCTIGGLLFCAFVQGVLKLRMKLDEATDRMIKAKKESEEKSGKSTGDRGA